MDLLKAERIKLGVIFLTWVTVCSVKGTSSPYKEYYITFTADSQHHTLLNILKRR